ncbi:unnamed protein product [Soboliphyme baturini]|uniref:BTB domain-containing protein n=1 Tax=Soboliphyme baturini TaxID=241478 RepID=A0A183IUY2_9BILA|nr:unnamed protein product [Soboliphyme baturini]
MRTEVVTLNVGGLKMATTLATLTKDPSSLLATTFAVLMSQEELTQNSAEHESSDWVMKMADGCYFIDRNGPLFRHILDYLRNDKLILPCNFNELDQLLQEAKFYRLSQLVGEITRLCGSPAASLSSLSTIGSNKFYLARYGHITISYRGTFAFGRNGPQEVNFRKLNRILVCGRATLCREVFGDTLNESRDPDRGGENRYTSRMFLKHNSLEQAFDMLAERGFSLITSCSSGAMCGMDGLRHGTENEENKWNHYTQFVFFRGQSRLSSYVTFPNI